MMTLRLWTLIPPLIGGGLMLCLLALPHVRSQHEQLCSFQEEECTLCASATANETLGAATDAQWQVSSCTDKDYNPEEDELITESSYTPPFNHTYPAPKTAQGIGSDMGEPQELDSTYSDQILARIEKSREYIQGTVMVEDKYISVRSICQNKHSSCAFWSILGECEKNPAYMHINCSPVCESCEMLHIDTRCPIDPNAVDAWSKPGDLNKTFEKILSSDEFALYQPVILSQPPQGPWVIQFDNFLSELETERLIELGHQQTYERSSDVGERQPDGTYSKSVNEGRTSTNAWCLDECYTDPIARQVMDRIQNVTGIPETNSENLQLLRYKTGEFYQTHNDFIPYQRDRQSGVRILTFYIYLSDVEEGGGTDFPKLGKTVIPKRGRAVLWPSVLDSDPNAVDVRTNHQALPVVKGVKFGANAWIHQRDFKGPNSHACN